MGGWRLESFKMGVYMLFPVGVFWWFNQPGFFEDWMMSHRKELFPPSDPKIKETYQKLSEMSFHESKNAIEEELVKMKKSS